MTQKRNPYFHDVLAVVYDMTNSIDVKITSSIVKLAHNMSCLSVNELALPPAFCKIIGKQT